jgi:integrase
VKYVHFVRGRYIVRVTVPPELRGILGKRELAGNLGADKKVAGHRAHGVIAGFLARIDEAREQLEASKPTLSSLAKEYYRSELEADDRGRLELGQETVVGLNEGTLATMARYTRLVASGQLTGEPAEDWVGQLAELCHEKGMLPDVPRDELLKMLARVELDILAAIGARDRNAVSEPEPKSELLTAPEPEPLISAGSVPRKQAGGASLTAILKAFHKERTAGNRSLAEKTMDEHKVAVRMFEEFLSKDIPARSITRGDLLAYKQALLETPSRYAQRFPGLTLPQAIKANAKRKQPFSTLDPATINMKWLSHLSTIFRWASNNGYLDSNPADGVRVDEGHGYKEPSRVPFSQGDLKRIFGSDLFKTKPYETKQWALLVALYTGARSSSEIARIRLCDIYEEQGVPVIMLALASKNQHSKRLVPIHDDLVRLGFLDFVERLRRKSKERLFPDWDPEDKINRWFLRSYRAEVGINDRRKVFHSFRHTLKTALARYGVNRDISDLITGHKDQSVGGIYIGDASVTMVKAMAEGLNRVDFDLGLSTIK